MNITTRFATIFLCGLVLTARANAQAQDMKALSQSIVTAVQAQEPGWQLQGSLTWDRDIEQRWGNRYERSTISVSRLESADEATSRLDFIPQTISSGAAAQRRTDIGDDALMYSRNSPTGSAVIYFRKGTMIGTVTGPSEDITIRFARLVASRIL